MPLPPRPLTVAVCESDPVAQKAYARVATDLGFEVTDSAENGPRLLQLLEFSHPSLVLVANDLYGMSGLEVVEELVRHDGHPESIIISPDDKLAARAHELGVIAVPIKGDIDGLERALGDAKHLFVTGERRGASDRRSGGDRRQQQDWSKVTQERRQGDERRQGSRRTDERAEGDDRREVESADRREGEDWSQVTSERRTGLERRK